MARAAAAVGRRRAGRSRPPARRWAGEPDRLNPHLRTCISPTSEIERRTAKRPRVPDERAQRAKSRHEREDRRGKPAILRFAILLLGPHCALAPVARDTGHQSPKSAQADEREPGDDDERSSDADRPQWLL